MKNISAEIIDEDSFSEIPEKVKIIFFGDGAMKCRELIKRNNSVFADDFKISASHMHKPAYKAFSDMQFENVAHFEPFYLKDFITTLPKRNILGI